MGVSRIINMISNLKNWDAYLLYKMRGKQKDNFTFQLKNNYSVTVPREIQPEFKESLFEEVYFKQLPEIILQRNNPVVIDIGANVGFFTISALFKLKNPRVISFEPMKRNFVQLQKNLEKAGDRVTLVNKAVNDVPGELVLKFNSSLGITTSASLFDNQYGTDEEKVQATTLENVFSDYQLSTIDLLKLDCEGAEYNILYNTPAHLFKRINCIALETHPGKERNENKDALEKYLAEIGFVTRSRQQEFIWAYKKPDEWN
jgi:FkbM family methyltransferase